MTKTTHVKLSITLYLLFALFITNIIIFGETENNSGILDFDEDTSEWKELQADTPTGTQFMLIDNFGGWWADAEKNPAPGDDLLCWAAASSNILEWTGWGYVDYMDHGDTDDFFNYFEDHVTDQGSWIAYGLEWWLNGFLDNKGDTWAVEDVSHTGFWSGYDPNDYIWIERDPSLILPELRAQIIYGRAVGLSIYPIEGRGGHAVTVWGLNYDETYTPGDPEYYLGVWITDSDSHKDETTPDDVLKYYALDYDDEENFWYMPNYGPYDGWYIGGFAAMAPFPGEQRPIANGGPYSGFEGTPLIFTHTSTDPDNDPLEFRIDYNADGIWDTQWASGQIQKTFYDDYDEDVIIEVFDGRLRDTYFTTINIENVAPIIDIGQDRHVNEGDTVPFWVNINDPGLDTHTIEWFFGDGTTASDERYAFHVYLTEGIYEVSVQVTDDDGGFASQSIHVYVENGAPIVDAGPDQTVNQGDLVQLHGSYSDPGGEVEDFWWNFGDGIINSGEINPIHVFYAKHVYPVTLYVMDDMGAVGVDVVNIKVLNVPPSVEAGVDLTVEVDELISFHGDFTDPGLEGWSILWNFGDGNIAVDTLTPSHKFSAEGVYTVTLLVQDYYGGEGTDSITVTVENKAPIVDAGSDQTVTEGDTVNFEGDYSDDPDGYPWTIDWDFDDGNTPIRDELKPTRIFYGIRTYSVALTVTDTYGYSGTDIVLINVLNVDPEITLEPTSVVHQVDTLFTQGGSFTDPGLGGWTATVDYGNGLGVQPLSLTEKTFQLSNMYTETGEYTITVTVTDENEGVGEVTITVIVDDIPEFDLGPDEIIAEGSLFTREGSFMDFDLDTWGATVDYGDGSGVQSLALIEEDFQLNNVYTDDGDYTITVRIEDSGGGIGEDTIIVTVLNVAPTITTLTSTADNYDIILPIINVIDFQSDYFDPGADTVEITWDLGDGTTVTGTLSVQHTYLAPGEYIVTFIATDDDGGSDTDTLTVTVNSPQEVNEELEIQIGEIFPENIKGNNINKINALLKMINALDKMYEAEDYGQMISFLNDNLLAKMDGIGKNDWVLNEETRNELTQIITEYIAYLQTLLTT
jgi:PKD repeat protein